MDSFIMGDPRVFIGVTLVLGGLASVASGRAVALGWRSLWLMPLYGLPLAFAMRFLSWALFGEPLAAPFAALLPFVWSVSVQALTWRLVHAALNRRQYPWLTR
jgi:hypothetical protein